MIPLETACVADRETRNRHVRSAMARGLPAVSAQAAHSGTVAIVGSGPSIRDHLPEIVTFGGDVWAINGAYDFLADHGRVSDFVGVDPSEAMLSHLRHPRRESRFYLASVTHPEVFDALDGFDVRLWHSEAEGMPDDCRPRVVGGTTCVTRAICLARMTGYRDITVYGAESSFAAGRNVDNADVSDHIKVRVGSDVFLTDLILAHQVSEISVLARMIPLKFRCGGLTQAMLDAPIREFSEIPRPAA